MARIFRVFALGAPLAFAATMECPGSGSLIHAGIKVTTTAHASCDQVKAEIKARIGGTNGWADPHNGGIYTLLAESDAQIKTQRTTNPAKAVGGKVYTDKQIFTFSDVSGSCEIQACSESQGFSVMDFSTNYCDIHNLYCNDAVCNPITSFATTETNVAPNLGSGGKDPSKCVPASKREDFILTESAQMECPSSGSFIHAGAEVNAVATASCDEVKAEIKARISGTNGWQDPHNGGIYTVLSESSTQLKTQRTTNPAKSIGGKVYTDKQIFSFIAKSDGTCEIRGCSQSQGFSIGDFSTNYCDLHNLYCNDSVCKPIKSFGTTELKVVPNPGSGGKDPSKCSPSSSDDRKGELRKGHTVFVV